MRYDHSRNHFTTGSLDRPLDSTLALVPPYRIECGGGFRAVSDDLDGAAEPSRCGLRGSGRSGARVRDHGLLLSPAVPCPDTGAGTVPPFRRTWPGLSPGHPALVRPRIPGFPWPRSPVCRFPHPRLKRSVSNGAGLNAAVFWGERATFRSFLSMTRSGVRFRTASRR